MVLEPIPGPSWSSDRSQDHNMVLGSIPGPDRSQEHVMDLGLIPGSQYGPGIGPRNMLWTWDRSQDYNTVLGSAQGSNYGHRTDTMILIWC